MKATCDCDPRSRRWNGYGTCLACGGAYEARGELAPIVIPPTVYEFPRDEHAEFPLAEAEREAAE